jgi:hypothetical protein
LLDYVIVENGRDVGRVYEDRHSRPELRWYWSITVYINPNVGITTSRARTDDERGQGALPTQLAEVPHRLLLPRAPLQRSRIRVPAKKPGS